MKRNSGASGSADRPAKRMSAVEALRLLNDDSEEDEFDLAIDYPDSELSEEENVDLDNISVLDQSESDVDLDLDLDQPGPRGDQQRGGSGTRPRSRPRQARTVSKFDAGWSRLDQYQPPENPVDTSFGLHVGPTNIPDYINNESKTLHFLSLFIDHGFWTNL